MNARTQAFNRAVELLYMPLMQLGQCLVAPRDDVTHGKCVAMLQLQQSVLLVLLGEGGEVSRITRRAGQGVD